MALTDGARRIADLRIHAYPVAALAAIRAAQTELGRRVDQVEAEAPIVIDVTAALDSGVRRGERRYIHRQSYKRVKPIPRRRDADPASTGERPTKHT